MKRDLEEVAVVSQVGEPGIDNTGCHVDDNNLKNDMHAQSQWGR